MWRVGCHDREKRRIIAALAHGLQPVEGVVANQTSGILLCNRVRQAQSPQETVGLPGESPVV